MDRDPHQEIALYLENAQEVLKVAQLSQSKHSGVISAFRQHFVKTGLIAPVYSDLYGRIMGDRHASDYELESSITKEIAHADLADAKKFVTEITQ